MSVRSEILRLLREDEELRYAVAGLLGLEDLKSTVKAVGEAVAKLAEVQKRGEERLAGLEEKAVRLEERMVGLEEKMVKLEERMVGLEDRVGGLEERVGRLEDSHIKLVESVAGLAKEVGRLSETVGFGLEDVARVVVPSWLYRHEGIVVDDLVRKFFLVDGVEVELNLYGEGVKSGVKVIILGEAKSRIYGDDVNRFYDSASKIFKIFREQIYLLMFSFYVHPSAEREAESKKIRLIASYMR